MKRGKWVMRLILLGLLVGWLLTGLTEVRPGERAVVRRLGRVLDVQPAAGLWVGLPWGIDRVDKVAIEQVRRVTVGYPPDDDTSREDMPPGQLLTGDSNLVNVQVVLNYAVDPEAVVDYVIQRERAEELLARIAEASLAQWIAGRTVDEVLLQGKKNLPQELPRLIQSRLLEYRVGVEVRTVDVAYLAPPDYVRPYFDQVAEAETRRKTMVVQARQEAERSESETAVQIRQLEDETRAQVTSRPRRALAEASYFEARLDALRMYPLVREAGRWDYLVRTVKRLNQGGQLMPLDPSMEPSLPAAFPRLPAP